MSEQPEGNPLQNLDIPAIRGDILKHISANFSDLARRRYETIIHGDRLIPYHYFLVGESLNHTKVQAVTLEAYANESYHDKLGAPIIKHYGIHDSIKVRIRDLTANELNMEIAIAIDQNGKPVDWEMQVQRIKGLGRQIVGDIS